MLPDRANPICRTYSRFDSLRGYFLLREICAIKDRLPLDLLRPFESEAMEMYEANSKVGNVRNNGPELMRAAAKAAEDGELLL